MNKGLIGGGKITFKPKEESKEFTVWHVRDYFRGRYGFFVENELKK